MENELGYYKTKEYEKLTKDQKAELHRLRNEEGGENGSCSGGLDGSSDQSKTISALQSKIDKLESLLSQTISVMESRDDEDSGDDKEPKQEEMCVI
jgi:hypothetical protein